MSNANVYVNVYAYTDDIITLPGYILTISTQRDIYSSPRAFSVEVLDAYIWQKILNAEFLNF